ncbi:MAG: hypothetical protein EBX35_09775, partial [Planctomycetia bacterium]|nr:hypothetical protein [Planctomycetia bacterium]
MVDDELLRRDVRLLGDMLGDVIRSLAGPEAFALVEEIRGLARARRAGDHAAEAALDARIAGLDEARATIVA